MHMARDQAYEYKNLWLTLASAKVIKFVHVAQKLDDSGQV